MNAETKKGPVENRANFIARISAKTTTGLDLITPEDQVDILHAYDVAKTAHRMQKRDQGGRYFEHPRHVALILMDECRVFDRDLIIAALLHDTAEDTTAWGNGKGESNSVWMVRVKERVSRRFGERVGNIVADLTKPKIDGKEIKSSKQVDEVYHDHLSRASIDSVLIKMCDRLHNLRTLGAVPKDKQMRKIKETEEELFPIFKRVLDKYPEQGAFLMGRMVGAIDWLKKDPN